MKIKIALAAVLLTVGLVPGVAGQVDAETNLPDSTSDAYQNDGHSGQDASDDCRRSNLTLKKAEPRQGQLVPLEDNADTWLLDVADGGATVEVTTSEALREAPYASVLLDFEISLQVFAFQDPEDYPPIVDCEEATYEDRTRSGGTAVVELDVQPGLTYFVQVEIEGAHLGDLGPMAMSGHCTPGCFQGYELTAS